MTDNEPASYEMVKELAKALLHACRMLTHISLKIVRVLSFLQRAQALAAFGWGQGCRCGGAARDPREHSATSYPLCPVAVLALQALTDPVMVAGK